MTQYSKINIIYRLQKWMDSVPGQTFLNYAYSWGASIVIAGTLFKLTHLPGANLMLFLGLGTEIVVFFLSAFDRPFDKTADGRDLPTHVTEAYLEGEEVKVNSNTPPSQSSEVPSHKLEVPSINPEMGQVQDNFVKEMENLNRTLAGISKVYELQLKSASQQMGNVDQVNEQTKVMAQQIEQLNKIYTRMIEAMTVNMRTAAPNVKTEI